MNPQPHAPLEKDTLANTEVESFFYQGEAYFHEYSRLRNRTIQRGEDRAERAYQIGFHRTMAIDSFQQCVNCCVPHEQQDTRIRALFFLVELHPDKEDDTIKEGYFYQAVELIQHYFGDELQNTARWDTTIALYLKAIHPEFTEIFPKKYIPFLSPLITATILAEWKKRMQILLEDTASIIRTGIYTDTPGGIIKWLEKIFGPMRIRIVAEDSGVEILSHALDQEIPGSASEDADSFHRATVEIFDKKTKYRVSVDRGGKGMSNRFKISHLEHIIYPVIDIYIQQREYALFLDASDHAAFTQRYEESALEPTTVEDYRGFIGQVLSQYCPDFSEEKITLCQQSIDICRIVSIALSKNDTHSLDTLPERIDRALGGTIKRSVFALVQSHLMTRHEMMNGTGYPFGLSKRRIPVESRMYAIIRAYEALSLTYTYQQVMAALKSWGDGGYFDADILSFFLDTLKDRKNHRGTSPEKSSPELSEYRKALYGTYINRWKCITDQIQLIEKDYDSFRSAYSHNDSQNGIAKSMNEGILRLRQIANIRTLFIVTRHGETESDANGGPPGTDGERINKTGKIHSRKKGNILHGLKVHILTSPLPRATESAHIICQKIHACVKKLCDSCLHVQEVVVLRNPVKNKSNGRYNSYAQKLFQDNTNGLMEFLIDAVSSSEESSNVYVTHRDSGRHLVFWLTNLFSQEKTTGVKTPIGNDTILVYLFQGDTCIPWNLLFPIFGWKKVLSLVNTLSQEVFGVPFYTGTGDIDLIGLHDAFLDFVDFHKEHSKDTIVAFRRKLEKNPLTRNLSTVIALP